MSKLNRFNFEIAELTNPEAVGPISGVFVSPERTVVTDGHCAVIVSSVKEDQPSLFGDMEGIEPADYFTPFILDRDTSLRVAKALPKKQDSEHPLSAIVDATTEHNEKAMVSVPDVGRQEIQKATKIEGTYPDIDKIIPAKDSANFSVRLTTDLLFDVVKMAQKFCAGHKCDGITVSFHGEANMMRIEAEVFNQTMVALLMPRND